MKSVCLRCESYSHNCHAACDGSHRLLVNSSFRPPKRGHKDWKLLRHLALPDLDPLHKDGYFKGFSSCGGGKPYDVTISSSKGIKADNWPKRWREKGFQKDVHERKMQEWKKQNPFTIS